MQPLDQTVNNKQRNNKINISVDNGQSTSLRKGQFVSSGLGVKPSFSVKKIQYQEIKP